MADTKTLNKRKKQQRSVETRDKILQSAKKLFVKHGFSGVKVEAVAKYADINHSLIYHHFKSKQALWLAVKQHIVDHSNLSIDEIQTDDLTGTEFIDRLVRRCIAFYHQNPHMVSLINWQRMDKSSKNLGVRNSTEAKKLIAAINRYQKSGDIKIKAKPEYILTMILGMTTSAVMDKNIFIKKRKDFEAYIDFCVTTLQKALC